MALPDLVAICNATAGTGCPADWEDRLREQFAREGASVQVRMLQRGADIQDAVREVIATGVPRLVASGGDGTISAIAAPLVGQRTALAVLPMGTLNHFAKDAGVPLALEEAVANAVHGLPEPVDVGEVNGRTFINNSSLGLYPDIVRDRERRQRRLGRGKWRALVEASAAAARRFPVLEVEIDLHGERHLLATPFVFVGNNPYSMEGFEIGERKSLRDGVLSLYVTQRTGRLGLLRLAFQALLHRLDQARDFGTATATRFVVRTGEPRIRVATDGEVTLMETPLSYRIRPAALRVVLPLHAA